eukprot:jgi/Tetstr1/449927/TSEL_036981.t1
MTTWLKRRLTDDAKPCAAVVAPPSDGAKRVSTMATQPDADPCCTPCSRSNSSSDDYVIDGVIGIGSFAQVRSVVDRSSGSIYAAKCFLRGPKSSKEAVASEVANLRLSQHPNVVGFYDYFEEHGKMYLVTELVPGSSLDEALAERGSYSEEDCRVVMKNLLSALVHMHAVGVAHRDIKTENVVLGRNDNPAELRLVDFGLAGRLTDSVKSFKVPCGTPACAAPEVLRRYPEYGTSCDIWSCGVLLFNLLSGAPPFDGPDLDALVRKIRGGKYSMCDPVWELISGEAKNFVRQLLTVNPSERPTAAAALTHPWLAEL